MSLLRLDVTQLITIGGDDTVASAMKLEQRAAGRIRVVHVPKTIDNDLSLPPYVDTFGYQTARHHGVEIVKNLMVDAKTTSRWCFVIAMGAQGRPSCSRDWQGCGCHRDTRSGGVRWAPGSPEDGGRYPRGRHYQAAESRQGGRRGAAGGRTRARHRSAGFGGTGSRGTRLTRQPADRGGQHRRDSQGAGSPAPSGLRPQGDDHRQEYRLRTPVRRSHSV